MSCLPLDHEALALLRRLRPQEALQVLQQALAILADIEWL